jgi:tetratricopeptide (TPR) repeat protein
MVRANQLYENGRFNQASQIYQQLADQDFNQSELLYNLGNAYYKQGDLGRAILNYERAARISPRDTDIQANLDFARGQTIDQLDTEPASPLDQWLKFNTSLFTMNEISLITLASFWLLLALIIIYRHSRRDKIRSRLQLALVVVTILFAVNAITLASRLYNQTSSTEAIVVVESMDLYSGPGEDKLTEFSLHSGTQIHLQETRGQWVRISLPGEQSQGWAHAGMVEKIN